MNKLLPCLDSHWIITASVSIITANNLLLTMYRQIFTPVTIILHIVIMWVVNLSFLIYIQTIYHHNFIDNSDDFDDSEEWLEETEDFVSCYVVKVDYQKKTPDEIDVFEGEIAFVVDHTHKGIALNLLK